MERRRGFWRGGGVSAEAEDFPEEELLEKVYS